MNWSLRYLQKKWFDLTRNDRDFEEQWYLRFCVSDQAVPHCQQQWFDIMPPDDRFYADPFVVADQGRYFIFFEEYQYANPIGYLSVTEVFTDGRYTPPQAILKQPYHLSYPNVFWHQDAWYMLPETHQNKTIELWRATDFPYQWQKHQVLMDNIDAADTTPFFDGTHWYLFTAIKQNCKKFGNRLDIFYADDLFSTDWQAHALNPVKVSLLHDRPAGQLFYHQGQLIRPVQDSIRRYGGGMELRVVDMLSPTDFSEHLLCQISAPHTANFDGIHTLNYAAPILVTDALRNLPRHLIHSPVQPLP